MSESVPEQINTHQEDQQSREQEENGNLEHTDGSRANQEGAEDGSPEQQLTQLEQREEQSRDGIEGEESKRSREHPRAFGALQVLATALKEMESAIEEEAAESDDDKNDLNVQLRKTEEKATKLKNHHRNLNEENTTFNSFSGRVSDGGSGEPEKPYVSVVKTSKQGIANELKKRQVLLEQMLSFVENRHGRDDRMKAVRKLIKEMEEGEAHLNNANDPFTAEIKDVMHKLKQETIANSPLSSFGAEEVAEYSIATATRKNNSTKIEESHKSGRGELVGCGKGFALLEENKKLSFKTVLDRFSAIKERLETATQMAKKTMSDEMHFPAGSNEQTQHVISVLDSAHVSEMKNLQEVYANLGKRHQDAAFLLRRSWPVKPKPSVRERNKERSSASDEMRYMQLAGNLHSIDGEIREMEVNIMANKKELKSLQALADVAATDLREMGHLEEADELKAKRKILEREKVRLLDLKRDVFETLQRVKVLKNSDDPISPYNR